MPEMSLSTTYMNCGITYIGQQAVPDSSVNLNLQSVYNRGWWIDWAKIEPAKGKFDWTLPDSWIAACEINNLTPIALFTSAPKHAYSTRTGKLLPSKLQEFVIRAAKRYAGKIFHWEFANEIDTEHSWMFDNYSGREAGRYFKVFETAIKSVNSRAVVIAPSIQSIWKTGHGFQTLAGICEGYQGIPAHVSVHVYPEKLDMSEITPALHRFWGALETSAKTEGVTLWATEVGLTGFPGLSLENKFRWLHQAADACKAGGVRHFLQYNLDQGEDPNYWGFDVAPVDTWNKFVLQYVKTKG